MQSISRFQPASRLPRAGALLAALAVGSAARAQEPQRYNLAGDEIAVYNLAGEMRVEPASDGRVSVEVVRAGDDAERLRVVVSEVAGRQALRVLYPSDRIVYRRQGWNGNNTLRVREDGTFGGGCGVGVFRDREGSATVGGRACGRQVRISGRGDGLEAHADLRVRVPAGRKIALYLGTGRMDVANVRGQIFAYASSAPVTTQNTEGSLTVDVGSGAVRVRDAEGNLDVDTGSGSVRVDGARGDQIRIDTGSGAVGGTRIEARRELEVDTGSGSIDLAEVVARDIRLDTGSGGVRLELRSDVDDLEVDTGSGGVSISVPNQFGALVEVDTGSGGIRVDLPTENARQGRGSFRGRVGDGRGSVRIDTGSGAVTLRRS